MSIATLDHDCFAAEASCEDVNSDEALLYAFATSRDDLAFAEVVTRHASLVMGVCRRVLGNEHDAEDAFQATFLVLARKASSLRNAKSLPAWLHKTAHRISLRARANRARRREQSLESEVMVEDHTTLQRIATNHERSVLDEELNRLPDRLRMPLFLCCLEGKSREEAARQLGWSTGSLKGRLERARQLLRRRLILRGVSMSVAVALVMRSQTAAHAAVPPDLVASTVQAGMRYAAGQSLVGYVSPHAHFLANWSLQAMSITSAKFVTCAFLVVGALTLGDSWTVVPAVADGTGSNTIEVLPTSAPKPEQTFVALLDDEREEGEKREGAEEREPDGRENA
ncbi:MAG: sigma-70 family RNA polymerase sigma factor, partial [Planctomycetota bacterium]